MKSLQEIDKNFNIKSKVEQEGIKFYNSLSSPFEIYGVYMDGGKFRRMPENVAKSINNDGVVALHANTAVGDVIEKIWK